jgi:regulator of replication initiation timing
MADALGLVKDISQVVKNLNNLELLKQIIDLQTAVFEHQQENLRLSRELMDARERLDTKDKLKLKRFGDVHYFVVEGEDVQYCSPCYATKKQLVPLPNGEPWNGGFRRVCPACKNIFYERPMRDETFPAGGRDWPWSGQE